MTTFDIRPATEKDIPLLEQIAAAMNAHHEQNYFARCLSEQAAGARLVFIAGREGYAQLIWNPEYAPFKRLGIPELQDVNVIPAARRRGLGRALVEYAEEAARQKGKTEMGLGVGLHARFGAAQRLYVAMGYVPDGAGLTYDEVAVAAGEMRPVDDLLMLKLIRFL